MLELVHMIKYQCPTNPPMPLNTLLHPPFLSHTPVTLPLPPCNHPPSLPELLLTEVVAGARVVVLLEGGVQPGVDAHLKHGDGQTRAKGVDYINQQHKT